MGEEILKKLSCHTVMNVHVKPLSYDGQPYPEDIMKKIVSLIREYDCEKYVYFMCGNDTVLRPN